jgi:hypothetical protein
MGVDIIGNMGMIRIKHGGICLRSGSGHAYWVLTKEHEMLRKQFNKNFGLSGASAAMILLGGMVLAALPGCQSHAYEQADTQVADAKGVRGALVHGQKEVDATSKALSDLTGKQTSAGVNSKALFDKYAAELATLGEASKKLNASIATFKETSSKFFAARSGQINSIANPDVRNSADASLKDSKAKFQALATQVDGVAAEYPGVIAAFNDLKTLLSNDLSKSGLESASKVTGAAYEKANNLRLKTDAATAAIDAFTAEVAPATVAPAKK